MTYCFPVSQAHRADTGEGAGRQRIAIAVGAGRRPILHRLCWLGAGGAHCQQQRDNELGKGTDDSSEQSLGHGAALQDGRCLSYGNRSLRI
jgi:hypothetical protein